MARPMHRDAPNTEVPMRWIKVTNPEYEQSRRYSGQVGEVVGRWGPDSEDDRREGFLVEFADGEIVGIAGSEIEEVTHPGIPELRHERRCG
jgi:hypothetical protein